MDQSRRDRCCDPSFVSIDVAIGVSIGVVIGVVICSRKDALVLPRTWDSSKAEELLGDRHPNRNR